MGAKLNPECTVPNNMSAPHKPSLIYRGLVGKNNLNINYLTSDFETDFKGIAVEQMPAIFFLFIFF